MRKGFVTVLLVVICSGLCFSASGESDPINRVRNAYQICWAGDDFVALKDAEDQQIQLINLSNGQILLDQINSIVSTGNYACAETLNGTWLIDSLGNVTPLKKELKGDEYFSICGKYGLFFGDSEGQLCVYNPVADTFIFLPGAFSGDLEIYTDGQGNVFVLDGSQMQDIKLYRADGKRILEEGKYTFVYNCDCDYVTNGLLTAWDEQGSVVLSAYTGEEICRFDHVFWEPYDSDHQIYPDNTASVGEPATGRGNMIVGIDGTILKILPEGQKFEERFLNCTPAPIYFIDTPYGSSYDGGVYNVLTDRTYMYERLEEESTFEDIKYTCLETGKQFIHNPLMDNYHSVETDVIYNNFDEFMNEGNPIPERLEKYYPVNQRKAWVEYTANGYIMAVDPEGKILGERYWRNLPWGFYYSDLAGRYVFFERNVCAVQGMNGLYGIMDCQGNIIVPAEYDKVEYIQSFSDDLWVDGYSIAAQKNGQWYLFNSAGEMR